ncbi:MAG: 3-dehydroquinate synthase [Candidatus Omnitrophica bacterium]|nr:3-dehydroquinate synthase [Candidatus Omnitrophota bacterium]MBI3082890.1 3-dehydroquinate synthase [Candidatus Omnitrophota bacterium]
MKISVSLGDRSYPIAVTDSYRRLPAWLASLGLPAQGWVVSHRRLLRRHGPGLLGPLQRAGWSLQALSVPESESSKSFAMAERIVSRLSRNATMRVPVLFAFGGGVVGDLTGFVAAIFHRGVPYVQLPTTLLAQVDSAIGGKVGVDLPHGKNLIGAFHQPRFVCNNVALLHTLPLRQRQSGLAEVIKYGMIADGTLFAFLEDHLSACLRLEPGAVRVMVERSCSIKARMVSQDERETRALRTHLNFGHTLGHALEAATGYRRWTHGEAIAIGMCAAAHLSVELGLLPAGDLQRLARLIDAAGLPRQAAGVSREAVGRALRYDKKFIHGRPRWVLPTRIGRVIVTEDVPGALVSRVLTRYLR